MRKTYYIIMTGLILLAFLGCDSNKTTDTNGTVIPSQMILIPGGTFLMGWFHVEPTKESDAVPSHKVTVSSFYMSKHEVTQHQWNSVMDTIPSFFTGDINRPVEKVSWYDCIIYCNKRSVKENLTPCYNFSSYGTNTQTWPETWTDVDSVFCNWNASGYRLPTEAEWEYAARGGELGHNYRFSGSHNLNEVAWYFNNSGMTPHTVGQKMVNELNICDMSGNVWEWCWDKYGPYTAQEQTNPTGPTDGTMRTIRGGSFNDSTTDVYIVYYRGAANPLLSGFNTGLRVVRKS